MLVTPAKDKHRKYITAKHLPIEPTDENSTGNLEENKKNEKENKTGNN